TGTVVVDTPANDVYVNGSTVSTTITGTAGGNFENLVPSKEPAVTSITDSIDNTTVTLSATPTVSETGAITYTASIIDAQGNPVKVTGSDVVVTLANSETITIPVGQSGASINVNAPNDVYTGAAPIKTEITTTSGGNFENLGADKTPVETTVTDRIDDTAVTLTASPSTVEGGPITYTATITDAQGNLVKVTGSDVVVTLANGETITIPVGQSGASINVNAPNDAYNGAEPIKTSITGTTGGDFENLGSNKTPVETTVTDKVDTTTVTLSATPSVDENGTITYTATLTDAQGQAVTAHNGP
ncbi:immunoglobulin-like domain-containing protein, partial [Pseudomonas sp. GM48]|uniref:immunoglobulin-like domain-containing protein n=1 Tax=Pseudomonas sp. GM48 TaxID=1144330 RepID=UPI0002705300